MNSTLIDPDSAKTRRHKTGRDALSRGNRSNQKSKIKSQKSSMTLLGLQQLIRDMYLPRDVERGVEGTFMWLVEEVGELATALRHGTKDERAAEFADVLAWLATIANVSDIDLGKAVLDKYGGGCPGCHAIPCKCSHSEKP